MGATELDHRSHLATGGAVKWLIGLVLVLSPLLGCAEAVEPLQPVPPAELEPLPERYPIVREILFKGNTVTKRKVMDREMRIEVGDPARPNDIKDSRQAIQNIGLFKQVIVDQVPVDGGVALVFTVVEKWYLLPYPRLDYNSDREFAFGFKLDWSNMVGLNHQLEALVSRQENAEDDRGDATEFEFDYFAPYAWDSAIDVGLGVSHDITPIEEEDAAGEIINYKEDYSRFSVLALRRLTPGHGSQGWRIGGGLLWQNETLRGTEAPLENGMATAAVIQGRYEQIDDRLYSQAGWQFGWRVEAASEDIASDYDYIDLRLSYFRAIPLWDVPHQTLRILADVGSYHGGPRDFDAYGLGGGSNLRGFDKEEFEGDAYWRLSLEYQRPLFGYKPVRGLVVMDLGRTYEDFDDLTLSHTQADAGIGLRWRIQTFVDLTLELGYAWPLTRGGSEPFFGKL